MKKILITEKQFEILKNNIIENYDNILNDIKKDDVLNLTYKGNDGKTYELNLLVKLRNGSEILATNEKNTNIKFFLSNVTKDSFEGYSVDKDSKTQKKFKLKLIDLNIHRNNDIVDDMKNIVDDNDEEIEIEYDLPSESEIEQALLNYLYENESEEKFERLREIYKTISFDFFLKGKTIPSTIAKAYVNALKENNNPELVKDVNEILKLTNKEKKYEDEEIENTSLSDIFNDGRSDEEIFGDYYEAIINNPELKDAFYKSPSLWNYITATIKKEKAVGTGILPAFKIIDSYFSDSIDKKFIGFTDKFGKTASFIVFDKIVIDFITMKDKEKQLIIPKGENKAIVSQNEVDLGVYKILKNQKIGYKIVVKKEIENKPNFYECDFYVDMDNVLRNEYYKKQIVVKFINSDGYNEINANSKK